MRMTSQDYAELAEHSYDRAGNMRDLKDQELTLEGVTYKVLEFVDNPRNGYQGTIYQRMDSGEIIVAHRGTEFERERWNDLVKTDGAMVFGRVNPQAGDAIALTQRAREIAEKEGQLEGRTPEVTVTGHSLGGTLAQITAHHFDLRGETFNAYGAVSLSGKSPGGGGRVINHVMAADAVSAASPHYGQVRMYALPREITTLQGLGYHNNRLLDAVTPDRPILAAGASVGSHAMHQFLPVDGNGRPDRSVLDSPQALQLAAENLRLIQAYRNDVANLRGGVTTLTHAPGMAVANGLERLRSYDPKAWDLSGRQSSAMPDSAPYDRTDLHKQLYADSEVFRSLNGTPGPHPPLRAPGGPEVSRAHLGPLQVQSGEARSGFVDQLLQAARNNDPEAMKAATQGLQQSAFGQAWQQKVDALVRSPELVQPDMQRQSSPAELVR